MSLIITMFLSVFAIGAVLALVSWIVFGVVCRLLGFLIGVLAAAAAITALVYFAMGILYLAG